MTIIKRVLITIVTLITILFAASLVLTSQTAAMPIVSPPPLYYSAVSLQEHIINKMITTFNPRLSTEDRNTITGTIIKESYHTNFDPLLIASIIATESSFRPRAVSPSHARGLMQITACVSQIMNISDPFDIRQNIYAGTRYLMDLSRQFKRYDLILAAYNAGPTRVARLNRVPRITETINYIRRVSGFYRSIRLQLLTTIKAVLGQPDFCPVPTSSDHASALIAIFPSTTASLKKLTLANNEWCEVDRSLRLISKNNPQYSAPAFHGARSTLPNQNNLPANLDKALREFGTERETCFLKT